VAAGIAFPHAAQAIRVVRRRRPLNGKNSRKWSTEMRLTGHARRPSRPLQTITHC
jgi:hypothetical protein